MVQESPPAEAAEAETCQARRMEIVGRLTGGIVHDFNNILTVLIGTIEILAEAVADRPELTSIAGMMEAAAARGADLASHLLAFARGQPSQPRDVDLNALLADAARLLRPALGEQIEIHSTPAGEVPLVLVDPSQLMTEILGLAIIARDAMPEGGKLIFEATTALPEVSVGEAVVADVMITVRAVGCGISTGHLDRIFADIDTVRDFVKRCHGHVEVCHEAGEGTSVRICLPRATGFARPRQHVTGESHGGNEAVLIVEDDVLVRRLVVSQVQDLGYRTFAAGNADEALRIVDSGATIDLLFTDVIMPGSINGRQLAIEAVRRKPSLKVLYTSGYSQSAMVRDGSLDAEVLLLAKPYRKIDLTKMIRKALAT